MAQKKITDLLARTNFDSTCNVPVDDATQTWRVTATQIADFVLPALGVTTAKLAAGAVTTAKITDANITRAKMANGAVARVNVVTKTTTYSISDDDDVIIGDTTSAGFTVTLPLAATYPGRRFTVKKIVADANTLTVGRTTSDTIDGATTFAITGKDAYDFVSDGSNWYVL